MFDFVNTASGTSFTGLKCTKLFHFDKFASLRQELSKHIIENAKNASRKRVFSERNNNVYYEQDSTEADQIKTVKCEWHVLQSEAFDIHTIEITMNGHVSKIIIVNGPDRKDYFETHALILMRMQNTFFDIGGVIKAWLTEKFEVTISDLVLEHNFLKSELDREVPYTAHLKIQVKDLGGLLKIMTLAIHYDDLEAFATHRGGLYAGITEFLYEATGMKVNTSDQFELVSLLTNQMVLDKRGKLKIIKTGLPSHDELFWIESLLIRLTNYARSGLE
ncbi:hypothetical protein CJU89_0096 [Yarrowia sp. B02]|nr:hypothetical protein CJU89_0096 [Yarrowia sp. B02]